MRQHLPNRKSPLTSVNLIWKDWEWGVWKLQKERKQEPEEDESIQSYKREDMVWMSVAYRRVMVEIYCYCATCICDIQNVAVLMK